MNSTKKLTPKSDKARCADILVTNHGTIATLRPLTGEAQLWLEEHVNTDFGCNPVYCEPRYVPPIIEGAQEAGFKIQVI